MPPEKVDEKKIGQDDPVKVYRKPSCSTCRAAEVFLVQKKVPYVTVNYHERPLTRFEIWQLLDKLKMKPRDILRRREPLYKKFGLDHGHHTDDELVTLMEAHPELIERPIVEKGDHAVLARPVDTILQLLKKPLRLPKSVKPVKPTNLNL
ncbi:arsenate reductase [Candidatus Uhrbacteria bacterium CG10_big_fil_rev_8_21_14_0_10_48_11]|uniref:Arsenate reductase n=1 Tax=Candidatus Uhrbacteria bacterium CG10_big_fil_rev_8_21_14_0_10_48_11 TaxID=1975037 RepID=A0A2M8LFF5_9BACT|nr:MAG: arsenate reductase [Candidatus Uhrbacteria bacterium CG10_big_fil_rev_8_21_14_0_10_48_11]